MLISCRNGDYIFFFLKGGGTSEGTPFIIVGTVSQRKQEGIDTVILEASLPALGLKKWTLRVPARKGIPSVQETWSADWKTWGHTGEESTVSRRSSHRC